MKFKHLISKKVLMVFLLLMSINLVSAAWEATLNNDLLAYWDMDDPAVTKFLDLTGNGNDGDIVGAALGTTDAHLNNGVEGDWSNANHINITSFDNAIPALNRSFSMFGWVMINGSQGGNPGIFHLGGAGSATIGISGGSSNNLALFKKGTSIDITGTSNIANSTFYFIGVVVYSNGTGQLWVNNVKETVDTTLPSYAGTDAPNFGDSGTSLSNVIIDEWGIWNRVLTETEISDLFNSGVGAEFIPPVVTLNVPTQSGQRLIGNILFNASVISTEHNLTNATMNVWYSNGTVFNNSVTNTISGENITNSTTFNISGFPLGEFTWNVLGCIVDPSSTICQFAPSNHTLSVRVFAENSQTYVSSIFETSLQSFILNASADGGEITTATFIYDGISYSTLKTGNNFEMTFNATIDIPTISTQGNVSFHWDMSYGGTISSSVVNEQNVSFINLELCNSTYTTAFINYTFFDEGNLSVLNSTVSNFDMTYHLGRGTTGKTLSFTNSTENVGYNICGLPSDVTYKTNTSMTYTLPGYESRTYEEDLDLTNTSTNKQLFLLASGDGLFVTFQVINPAEQPLNGVSANATRTINGSTELVGSGFTDAAGSITFWLNPDISHFFVFQGGGQIFETIITPTQTSYTVILGQAEQNLTLVDYKKGISFNITPSNLSLVNNTDYNFSFTLDSSIWTIENFGFVLTNGTTVLDSSNLNEDGGSTSLILNTEENQTIIMDYFWVIDGNFTNGTYYWSVSDGSGSEWSINNFFVDLKSYFQEGIFGLDRFGLSLISFLIIFTFVGIMSFRFGLTSPAAIMGLLFGLTAFLNVGVDIIPTGPSDAIWVLQFFPTIFVGIIFLGILIREVGR